MEEMIRNFSILAHIDHGKSTLADRFLELTGSVAKEKMKPQYLDRMDLEKERGITIKMHPVRMYYSLNFKSYILNLIDTPGHVDFNYEVSRSLAAVEGAILLVDVTKGVQAQTIGGLELAKRENLVIIPVINKIDLPQAQVEKTEKEMTDLLKINSQEVIKISAKTGENIERLLKAVIERIPPPRVKEEEEGSQLKALVFDSKYDAFKGVLAFVRIFEGEVKKGDKVYLFQAKVEGEVREVGVLKPEFSPVDKLSSGEIGYIATGIKEAERVRAGETITKISKVGVKKLDPEVKPLPGYKEPQPKVFLSIFPEKSEQFELLKSGLEKLKLTDASLYFKPDFKESLGRGFQCGFLGLLHAEIVSERLKREFGLDIILSTPSVAYKVVLKSGKEVFIYTAADWPEQSSIVSQEELWAKLQILAPSNYLGQVLELSAGTESKNQEIDYLGPEKVKLICEMPLREIINKNFYDKLKSISRGFASMDYEILGWREAKLVKLDILILGRKEKAFSQIVPEKDAFKEGKKIIDKLKEKLPQQLFAVPLQAAVEGKIIARETIGAKRRDVLAPLYGGDYTRKKKLLEKQKEGKKELKEKGKIKISPKLFLEIFRSE